MNFMVSLPWKGVPSVRLNVMFKVTSCVLGVAAPGGRMSSLIWSITSVMLNSTFRVLPAGVPNHDGAMRSSSKIDEAKTLIEAGFDYVCELNGIKLFRKRK